MKQDKKTRLLRALLFGGLFLAVAALVFFALRAIMPGLIEALESGDEQALEAYLGRFSGAQGMLHCFALQFLQILSVVLPGTPLHIAAGLVLGTWRGTVACLLGNVCANTLVFGLARRLGKQMDALLPIKQDRGRLSFITNSAHPALMVGLAEFMPFLPNGVIPYVASRTKVRVGEFSLAVLAGALPGTLLSAALGRALVHKQFGTAILLGVLFVVLAAVLLLSRRRLVTLYERSRVQKRPGKKTFEVKPPTKHPFP